MNFIYKNTISNEKLNLFIFITKIKNRGNYGIFFTSKI